MARPLSEDHKNALKDELEEIVNMQGLTTYFWVRMEIKQRSKDHRFLPTIDLGEGRIRHYLKKLALEGRITRTFGGRYQPNTLVYALKDV